MCSNQDIGHYFSYKRNIDYFLGILSQEFCIDIFFKKAGVVLNKDPEYKRNLALGELSFILIWTRDCQHQV